MDPSVFDPLQLIAVIWGVVQFVILCGLVGSVLRTLRL